MSRIRKHLTQKIFNTLPEINDNQTIAKVVGHRGSNQLTVQFAESNEKILVVLPKKFQKMIWIKKGDFVVITYDRSCQNIGKIKGIVERLLLKNQIKYLKKNEMWPKEFLEKKECDETSFNKDDNNSVKKVDENEGEELSGESEGEYEEEGEEEYSQKINNPNYQYYSTSEDEDSD